MNNSKNYFLLFLLVFNFSLAGFGQELKFYLSNNLKFISSSGDTIPAPFTGGMLNPIVNMVDLNNDNIKDLIIFDKAGNKITCYLNAGISNQTNFIHSPKYEEAFPKILNWLIMVDYNCDGKEDIFTGTEVSTISYYRNTSSPSKLSFSLIQHELVDTGGIHIYSGTSDLPAITDVDNDGDYDILAFGPLGGVPYYFRNLRVEMGLSCDSIAFYLADFCWGSFQESAVNKEIYIGESCFNQKYYKNDWLNSPIIQNNVHGASTLLLLDNDGDGDKDLLLGDTDYSGPNFIKNGKAEFNYPYDSMVAYDTLFPLNTEKINILSFPALFYHDVNNDNKKDLLAAPFDVNRGQSINQIWMYPNAGLTDNPNFQSPKKGFLSDLTLDFGSRTLPYFFDSDGDGDLDLILSARGENIVYQKSKDRLILFENKPFNNTPYYHLKDTNWLNFMSQEINDLSPVFVDLNSDNLSDLLIGERSGKIRYYKNTGTATNPLFTLENPEAWGVDVGTSATISVLDFNKDGLIDLLIGAENGRLKYFQNIGTTTDPQFSSIPTKNNFGEINVNDFDWGNYVVDPVSGEYTDSSIVYNTIGYSAPFVYDLNQNDSIDLIVGSNQGRLFIYYDISNYNDSLIASDTIFYSELNKKGINYNLGGACYPYVGKIRNDSIISILSGSIRGGLLYFESSKPETSNSGSLSLDKKQNLLEIKLFPNPAYDHVWLSRDLSHGDEEIDFEIYDALGKLVKKAKIPQGESSNYVNTNTLSSGIYFIHFEYNKIIKNTVKLIVIK